MELPDIAKGTKFMPSLTIFREDPVDYLVKKRRQQTISHLKSQGQPVSTAVAKAEESELVYLVELEDMPPDALEALYNAEKELDRLAKRDELEYHDSRRFFQQTDAAADFDHWSKAAYWTPEEGIALVFGKEPHVVNASSLAPYVGESLFAQRFAKAADLAVRAFQSKQLDKQPAPSDFIEWALKNDLPVAVALINLVAAQGGLLSAKEERQKLRERLLRLTSENDKGPQTSLSEVSDSFSGLEQQSWRAIKAFPEWRKRQTTVQKTGNLHDWLKKTFGVNNRDAEFIKKVLSDYFGDPL